MEALTDLGVTIHDLIQNQIVFNERMTEQLKAINSEERAAQEQANWRETTEEPASSSILKEEERAELQHLRQKYTGVFPKTPSEETEGKGTVLCSKRQMKLLLEIDSLKEELKTASKALRKRVQKVNREKEIRRQRERERDSQRLREMEAEFMERELKMKVEFAEREKVREKEREELRRREISNIKKENWMEDRLRRMAKELEDLQKRSEPKPEKKRRSFRKTARHWMDRFMDVFRRY